MRPEAVPVKRSRCRCEPLKRHDCRRANLSRWRYGRSGRHHQQNSSQSSRSSTGKIRIQRARRMFAEVPAEQVRRGFRLPVRSRCSSRCSAPSPAWTRAPTLGVIYHLAQRSGVVLNLNDAVPQGQAGPAKRHATVSRPPNATSAKLIDLLGMQVRGAARGPALSAAGRLAGGPVSAAQGLEAEARRRQSACRGRQGE